jgi:hypothetical protein
MDGLPQSGLELSLSSDPMVHERRKAFERRLGKCGRIIETARERARWGVLLASGKDNDVLHLCDMKALAWTREPVSRLLPSVH